MIWCNVLHVSYSPNIDTTDISWYDTESYLCWLSNKTVHIFRWTRSPLGSLLHGYVFITVLLKFMVVYNVTTTTRLPFLSYIRQAILEVPNCGTIQRIYPSLPKLSLGILIQPSKYEYIYIYISCKWSTTQCPPS